MPSLTPQEERRREAALTIVKTLAHETSVVSKPLTAVNIKNIPDDAEPAIKKHLQKTEKHVVYGSSAMATRSFTARKPTDLDVVVDDPRKTSAAYARILRNKGHRVKVKHDPIWNSHVVQIRNRKGEYVDAIDVHPIKGFSGKYDLYGESIAPTTRDGINIQRASDQLLRKANSVTGVRKDGSMGASKHREIKDTADFITTAKVLIASMEVRSEADKAKIKTAKKAVGVWEKHLHTLKGKNGSYKRGVKRVPLSEAKRKKFVNESLKNKEFDVDKLLFVTNKKIAVQHEKKPPKKSKKKPRRPKGSVWGDIRNLKEEWNLELFGGFERG